MMKEKFRKFAHKTSMATGTPFAFGIALGTIIIWSFLGHLFNYSDTWQLVINTGTTIITFLMVFLIQNSQNRDSQATQMKLDELIRANKHARNQFIDLEELSEEELKTIHDELRKLQEQTVKKLKQINEKRAR